MLKLRRMVMKTMHKTHISLTWQSTTRWLLSGIVFGLLMSASVWGAQPFFPLKDVRPGMKGTGKTVFRGTKIEEFQFEVLGVLRNIGPKQNAVLARLYGGPLQETGVYHGMSGSPVYIDGKLLGAVAFALPFSKEPIAGITPIEEMVSIFEEQPKVLVTPKIQIGDLRTRAIPGFDEQAWAAVSAGTAPS